MKPSRVNPFIKLSGIKSVSRSRIHGDRKTHVQTSVPSIVAGGLRLARYITGANGRVTVANSTLVTEHVHQAMRSCAQNTAVWRVANAWHDPQVESLTGDLTSLWLPSTMRTIWMPVM